MGFQEVMKSLADPTRREILNILKSGALPATEIVDHFSMSAAAISKHLSILREAELVRSRRDGKSVVHLSAESGMEDEVACDPPC